MAPQVHAVVQNACDLDCPIVHRPVQQQVAPASSVPGHVERMNTLPNVIALSGSCHIRSADKLSNGFHQGCSICFRLSAAEILGGPLQNSDEIAFSQRAEANPPSLRGHVRYLAGFEMTRSESLLR
jgi:hypothetical protein